MIVELRTLRLPAVDDAAGWLRRASASDAAVDAVIAGLREVATDESAARRSLELGSAVASGLGLLGATALAWPDENELERSPWVSTVAALSAVPHYLQWAADLGIPDAVVWATLSDLPRQIEVYRQVHGRYGFDDGAWLTLHLRGELFQLGRLQFHRTVSGWDAATLQGTDCPIAPGASVLGVHIPQSGPLDDGECEASFATARAFFARYFPDEPYAAATCGSWLLDPQLAEYLPAESNIVRFQRRFSLVPGMFPGDAAILGFVFHRRGDVDLAELPQTTALERAYVTHLRAGRHWECRGGWCPLP